MLGQRYYEKPWHTKQRLSSSPFFYHGWLWGAALRSMPGPFGGVTPFMTSAQSGDISNVKYLFDHGGDLMKADAQGRSSTVTEFLLSKGIPVDIDFVFATGHRGYTNFIRLLLKAGADPNIPDDVIDCDGLDATLYSNRSLCKLKLGDGKGALSDAYRCRTLRPDWAKACYRQAKAHMLLKEYKQACDALLDAQKLDPGNEEIERALSKAIELMKISPDEDEE
ncbi:hypothetical protein SETIT_9G311000v2 [Setaria italica]|uniref:Uncharacterized protein n=1 Tax=Setaria italica TaxID=4555 RepID=A0A368SMI9_SETIT|nr:hypothetical protein SETIT_9G311000v2 [Setaria italica]